MRYMCSITFLVDYDIHGLFRLVEKNGEHARLICDGKFKTN